MRRHARVAVRRAHVLRTRLGQGGAEAALEAAGALGPRLGHARWVAALRRAEALLSRRDGRRAQALRAEVAVRRSMAELDAGILPTDLDGTLRRELAVADAAWRRGMTGLATHRLESALLLAYHPALHFEGRSLLSEDAESFLAPFRDSAAFGALTARAPGRGSAPGAAGAGTGTGTRRTSADGAARRVLVVSYGGWTFVSAIIEDLRGEPGVEVRTLDLADLPDPRHQPLRHDLVRRRLEIGAGHPGTPVPESLREDLAWADVVLVEWGHRQLAWVSQLAGLRARVVTRVHSYEVFGPYPHLVDWDAVDDVVFVSPAIRNLAEAVAPALGEGPRVHTVPNRNLLASYERPKLAGAERTLALIGWNTVGKDAAWALDVLEGLRAADPAWRLLLVGDPAPRLSSAQAEEYFAGVRRRMTRLGDAVEVTGFTTDVPDMLRRAGVILSTSTREGTHEGLVQGVASGALPVVRNWPDVAAWGGPRSMYPADWVVETPQEAVARILARADDTETAAAAQRWVFDHLDWAVVRPRLFAAVLGAERQESRPHG